MVGYCPQHDALEGLLSARETLRMYARIKRVPSAQLEAEVAGPPLPSWRALPLSLPLPYPCS